MEAAMRLVTRSDFDGLICAVLLKEAGVVESYKFVHPKDIQDGKVPITEDDVLANVPYWPGCGLWFDHHVSESDVALFTSDINGVSKPAPSCARNIYEYYGGARKFPGREEMMAAVDKSDSGNLTVDEVLEPKGWILLSFIMDPRTGLGRFKDYRISNYQLMESLIEYCRTMPIDEILAHPDVQERVNRYFEQESQYRQVIQDVATVRKNCLILDLREFAEMPVGNRFIEYSLFPRQNISVRLIKTPNRGVTAISVGHSIINRTSNTNVGMLMKTYGGGGHEQVGTCQIAEDRLDEVLDEILDQITKDG
jgi:hypothetical protein